MAKPEIALVSEGVPPELAAMTWFNKSERHNAEAHLALTEIAGRKAQVERLQTEIAEFRRRYEAAAASAEECKEAAVAYALRRF